MQIEIAGMNGIRAKLSAAAATGTPALARALFEEAETIMTAAKQHYVPVDTGALRASGFVARPEIRGGEASVTLGFGGPAAPYAVIVHEDLTKRHPVGQAKYLETPLRARLQGMPAVLAMRTRDAIRQAIQRQGKIEVNVRAGREPLSGMPLFGAP